MNFTAIKYSLSGLQYKAIPRYRCEPITVAFTMFFITMLPCDDTCMGATIWSCYGMGEGQDQR